MTIEVRPSERGVLVNKLGVCSVWTLTVICVALATSRTIGTTPQPTQQASAPAQPAVQPDAQPSAQPAAASSQPAQPIPPPAGIASGQYSGDPDLRCDLLEVRRLSGGALIIRWRTVNTAPAQSGGLTASQPKAIHYDFNWPEVYYIDPAENKKYGFLTDAEGNRILDIFWGDLAAGQQRGNWAKFPAPPPTSNKVSVNIPKFPPFEDVPISQ